MTVEMERTIEIKTHDTYEASWYIMNGAFIKDVEFGRVQPNKKRKKGFATTYKLTLENVNPRAVEAWKDYKAFGNVRDFANARRKLKRKVDKVERSWRRK